MTTCKFLDKIWEWFGMVARHIHMRLVIELMNLYGQQYKTNNNPNYEVQKQGRLHHRLIGCKLCVLST